MKNNDKAPRKARQEIDWSLIWAITKGCLIGHVLGKLLGMITKALWNF